MNKAHFYNLTMFRTGAWNIKVNSIHLHHINRNQRYPNFCTQNHNTNTVEDEEHVLFHCPEYDTCRQECPDLILGNMSIKNISDFNNQETIAKLLWNIIMIRIWFRPRNPPGLIKAVKSLSHCAGTPNITPRGRHLTPRQHTTRPGEV